MEKLLKEYPFRTVLSLKPLIDYLNEAQRESGGTAVCFGNEIQEMLTQAPELHEPIEDAAVLERHKGLVKKLMSLVFPPVYWHKEALGAVVPFSMKPFFITPPFKRLFINEDGSVHGRIGFGQELFNRGRLIRAFLFVLEKVYGIRQDFDYPVIRIVPDPETGLERHYRMNIDFQFVNVRPLKTPKTLTDEERDRILENLTDPEILREILPPENFELQGFTVLQAVDVTESDVVSALERDLIDQESITSEAGFMRLQERLRTLFRRPDLVASLAAIQEDQILFLNTGCDMLRNCIFADSRHVPKSDFEGTVYERVVDGEEIIRIPDIRQEPLGRFTEEEINEMGVRSKLIAPLHYKGECIGTLSLGSPRPGDLGPMEALMTSQIQPLFSVAIKRALDDLDSRVQGIIKEKCTAVHPTVEWRFRKAALHHLEHLRMDKTSEMEPIVFKDVYPLYGVTDIRGSSDERNRAIQKDLEEHLKLGLRVVQLAVEARPLPILKELAGRIERHLELIKAGLGTGDELSVMNFLKKEVESVFSHFKGFGLKVMRAIETYESAIDSNIGTVYRLRKEFEESVSHLNDGLISYLDQEEAQAQAIFPHYFERHKTDGVDYLVYVGPSLSEGTESHEIYLKNLRLWQIKVACGLALKTEQIKPSLKIPLDTAHLILVQDMPLSIRFRFDEKRFDVDGAYDIRHEIIKSRIDKARIKDTKERLTQPGKIALVYAHPEEAREMRHHIDFLRTEGYLTRKLENLELEDLPGVQGLKSLRVGVNLQYREISEKLHMQA